MATIWEGSFAGIDPLTMGTIVQMQLQDSEDLISNAKGKEREGSVPTDAQLALRLYMDDLQSCDNTLQDRRMAQSIAIAVIQDGALIHDAYAREQQIARDRELAQHLTADTAPPVSDQRTKKKPKIESDPWSNPELLAKAAAIYMHQPDDRLPPLALLDYDSDGSTIKESSATAKRRNKHDKPAQSVCVACGDEKEFFEVARVPCDHEYCRPCLENLFRLSMKDETLFPPRCDGQEIPLELVRFFLPSDLAKEFNEKYNELSTKNRTYCFERSCMAFIPASSINNDIATCTRCNRTTCQICKAPSHSGDCPADTALQELVETANQQQWQRCSQCKRIVELDTGCNHISCPCGAHFCYVCGQQWKTCACDQWDENRLYHRAAQLVDRNPRRQLFQPPRVAHVQPATPPRPTSPFGDAVFPESSTGARATRTAVDASEWESDFSDHSEWEDDWWLNDVPAEQDELNVPEASTAHEPVAPVTARVPPSVTEAPRPVVSGQARNRLIEAAVEKLRANHECAHVRWQWVKGRHTCEQCHWVLKEYIFECKQCHLQACNRCRRNRL